MKRTYLIVPAGTGTANVEVTKKLSELAQESGRAVLYKPPFYKDVDLAKEKFAAGEANVLMENTVLDFAEKTEGAEIVVVEGLCVPESQCFARKMNELLALALDASVVLLVSPANIPESDILKRELTDARVRVVESVTPGTAATVFPDVLAKPYPEHKISQAEFRANLLRLAGKDKKRIVLPEGSEPRTVQAAVLAYERGIAIPVLLGKRTEIEAVAKSLGLELPSGLEIIEVTPDSAAKFVPTLVELRKAKGMTEELAKDLLKDSVWLGTMMLKTGEVDGLVSGALHSTADTVRPALQVIKTAPGVKSISSVFFMCLPSETLIYGDCAINLNPTAEELAGIAAQCNDTAKAFGLPARVALLSYSTGKSGKGDDVDLVNAALAHLKESRPDIVVDGPLQYDAASVESVAKQKMPGSPVAGKATVFVFPNLNSGNIGYKAVQRSAAGVISVGPMLQGLAKPVNDLSRGALVEDIVYTIALTAIQAQAL